MATIRNNLKLLYVIFESALEDEYINKNPVKGIKLKYETQENDDKTKVLTSIEAQNFLSYTKGTFYHNLFEVALNCGLRPGELLALTWNDINFEEGYIDVNKTLMYGKYGPNSKYAYHLELPKTKNSISKVPMTDICKETLKRQYEQRKNMPAKIFLIEVNALNLVFVSRKNTPLSVQTYDKVIGKIIKRFNLTVSE